MAVSLGIEPCNYQLLWGHLILLVMRSIFLNILRITIIPVALMASESIAREAEFFSKIQLVGQKYRDKTTLAS